MKETSFTMSMRELDPRIPLRSARLAFLFGMGGTGPAIFLSQD
jgi:hypothetical protein